VPSLCHIRYTASGTEHGCEPAPAHTEHPAHSFGSPSQPCLLWCVKPPFTMLLKPTDWHGLCCAVLCCAVLCCAVLCCAVLCCAVGRLPSLASLHLGDSRLASPALAHLTALTRLQQLSLEGEQGLDARLLQQLLAAGRLSLWEVRVRGCPGVSRDEVEEMVRGDPGAVTQVRGRVT
jgi:hypothetical protein